jgi:hypothetical protein
MMMLGLVVFKIKKKPRQIAKCHDSNLE